MKFLAISDKESPFIYDYFDHNNFKDVELVLAAGDLKSNYLSYIASVLRVPVLYVHGNHDGQLLRLPPGGCTCIDDSIYVHKGIRIAGIDGCMAYSGGPFQYTEKEMQSRSLKHRFAFRKGMDILLTHSPAYNLGDGDDLAHTGFKYFHKLLDRYQPKYMIHGHQHLSYRKTQRVLTYKDTTIVNAYEYVILDY